MATFLMTHMATFRDHSSESAHSPFYGLSNASTQKVVATNTNRFQIRNIHYKKPVLKKKFLLLNMAIKRTNTILLDNKINVTIVGVYNVVF